ncbi:MAG: hypothetical protein ACXW3J_07440 [Methylocystis sp.]
MIGQGFGVWPVLWREARGRKSGIFGLRYARPELCDRMAMGDGFCLKTRRGIRLSLNFVDGKILVSQRPLPQERYVGSTRMALVAVVLSCVMTGASIFAFLLVNASERTDGALAAVVVGFGVGFFGLCVCVFLVLLARPQTLLLDSVGFTLDGGLIRTPQKTAWRDVERFFVYRQGFTSPSMIGFDYAADRVPKHWLLKFNRAIGADNALPGGWALPTREMVARLNAYRARVLAAQDKFTK